MMELDFRIGVNELDFEEAVGRKPHDSVEFVKFAEACKTTVNTQITWNRVFNFAKTLI